MNTACQGRLPDRATKSVFVGIAGILVVLFLLPQQVSLKLISEGHIVENISALFLASAVVVAVLHLKRQPGLAWLSGTGMLLWAYLREMDYQKMFTYRSVESLGFYTRPQASLWEKSLALLILMPFVVAGLHLLWVFVKSLRASFAKREAWVGQVVAIFVLIALAFSAEKLFVGGGQIVEEVAELGLATFVLLLTFHLHKRGAKSASQKPAFGCVPSLSEIDREG